MLRSMSALFTDLYELTMAYAYWKCGMAEREACFSATFRNNPFDGGFTVACGIEPALEFLERFGFSDEELAYLGTLEGNDGGPLFSSDFLEYLRRLEFRCDVDAVPEGTIVFPNEPLLRVRGPLLQAQIVETAMLNLLNYQSLIATKAARIIEAAGGDRVVEFGLRRAHGFDGGLSASRAAYVGGCAGTSNVLAGHRYGMPVSGTLAHSFIMAFDDEEEAFRSFSAAMPNNVILLVDTYDTLEGVRKAVKIADWMKSRGRRLAGVRLDSGDLAYLSIEARKILDSAGLEDVFIVATNDLDEHLITSLKLQGARIDVWGVGTRLVTAWDQPALGGVYKLNAIRESDGRWSPRMKLSEQVAKTSNPGIVAVRRYAIDGVYVGDLLYDELDPPPPGDQVIIDPLDVTRRKTLPEDAQQYELIVPMLRQGARERPADSIELARERAARELRKFHPAIRRLLNPHQYPAGLAEALHERKTELVLSMKRRVREGRSG